MMPSKRLVPEQEIAELSDEMVRQLALKDEEIAELTRDRNGWGDQCQELESKIATLTEKLDAATCVLEDEEAAHQDTLQLLQQAKAEIATLTERRDEI